jgi:hypothetical protein
MFTLPRVRSQRSDVSEAGSVVAPKAMSDTHFPMSATTLTSWEGTGLRWHQTANGHWHAQGRGGDFDAIPVRDGGFILLWLPLRGEHVDLGPHQTLMGVDSAASRFAETGSSQFAAEQPGRSSYGDRRYLWKVSFLDSAGRRSFEIVEADSAQDAVEQVKAIVTPAPERFLFAKRLAAAAEGAEEMPLAPDGGCSHSHPPNVPSSPCGDSALVHPVVIERTDVAATQTAIVAQEEKAALRFAEVSFDKRVNAERFARFLERKHSTIVALHSGHVVTTNATHADIQKVLKAHTWQGGHRVGKSAGRYDLAAESDRRAAGNPPPKARRAKRAR